MLDEAVLEVLRTRQGEMISGEEISRLLKVSRSAVWKGIEKLREEGYQIVAQPHRGYQLVATPDRLTPQELGWGLSTRRIGRRIHAYDMTDSTMEVAHRLAAAGEQDGSVVVAEGQRRGRGRLSRPWVSPKGKGVYVSVILRPASPPERVPLITLAAAVAVARAIREGTALQPEIKWPNDLLLEGEKVAGILTELRGELERVDYVVLGIGVNVNSRKAQLPGHATSLAERMDGPVDRVVFTRLLLAHLDRCYGQFLSGEADSLLQEWRGFATFLGQRVRVMAQGRVVDGQALDIDSNGALRVRTDAGFVESISAGEVLIVK